MDEHFIKIHKWLYPVSWIYGAVVTVRNKLFDWGFLRSKSFGVPVICIGNLSVGGTGKTPHTEYLIKLLRDNYHVAVLSRGYKRHSRGYVLATPQSTARSIGDEPYQMHTKFPSVTLAVDENRCHGIEQLLSIKEPSIEVVLLDDAFQHRYVKPGLSILLTDYHRLFCDDTLLPAGRLRESVNGKNRAQIVIVTKCPQDIKPIDYNIITKRLNLYPYQQLYFSSFRYGNLQPVFPSANSEIDSTVNELPLSALTNTDILLVTGIASPAPILEELKMYTDQIDSLSFDDHHQVTDFKSFVCTTAGVGYKQCFDTQLTHYTYRESHFLHGITFIIMKTPLHCHDVFVAQLAENQFTAMTFDSRHREVRNIRILYFILLGDLVCQTAKSGAKDDGCFRTGVHFPFQKSCCFLYFL